VKKFLLRSEISDEGLWSVGAMLSQYWRPEFDSNIFPYLPSHVSRPKECLKIIRVCLPPRCVIKTFSGTTMEFVAVSDILSGGSDEFDEIIRSIPSLMSRFSLKHLALQSE